ncbi:MAG: hypothetical protein FD138_1642 [Planctomycetota bacterium]|nr:MAG: hypothetical protein FD138_1642 [Planctomycetota bacterium]
MSFHRPELVQVECLFATELLLAVLQERDQVGELFFRELFFQAGGHDADAAGFHLLDVGSRDAGFLIRAGGNHEFVGGLATDQAVHGFAVGCDDQDGLEAADEAGGGEQDRFEQVPFVADAADARQVGAGLASEIAQRVTGFARGLLVVEDLLTADDVARRQ